MPAHEPPGVNPQALTWATYERRHHDGTRQRIRAILFDPALGLSHYDPAPVSLKLARAIGERGTEPRIMRSYRLRVDGLEFPLKGGDWIVESTYLIWTVITPAAWIAAGWRAVEEPRRHQAGLLGVSETAS